MDSVFRALRLATQHLLFTSWRCSEFRPRVFPYLSQKRRTWFVTILKQEPFTSVSVKSVTPPLRLQIVNYLTDINFLRFCRSRQPTSPSVPSRKRRFPGRSGKPLLKDFADSWIPRVHFAVYPVFTLGNWIPRVLSQWYCSGHGCGFDQIVVENDKGNERLYTHTVSYKGIH